MTIYLIPGFTQIPRAERIRRVPGVAKGTKPIVAWNRSSTISHPEGTHTHTHERHGRTLTSPLGLGRRQSSRSLATGVGLNRLGCGVPQRRRPSRPTRSSTFFLTFRRFVVFVALATPAAAVATSVSPTVDLADADAIDAALPSFSRLSRHQVPGRSSWAGKAIPVTVWHVRSCVLLEGGGRGNICVHVCERSIRGPVTLSCAIL